MISLTVTFGDNNPMVQIIIILVLLIMQLIITCFTRPFYNPLINILKILGDLAIIIFYIFLAILN
jgi:nucleoside recognition membrane protein YjiH